MQQQELPLYNLRPSPRARRVTIKICRQQGLELIVPRNFNPQKVPAILQKHQRWIERTWKRIQALPLPEPITLPTSLHLSAIDRSWQLSYQFIKSHKGILITEQSGELVLCGNTKSHTAIKKALCTWLHAQANNHFKPWLVSLSKETGLHFTAVTIRDNSTRWGSCSAKKRISLDVKLLFLPPELVRYVMLHELCHTQYLDHSTRFWSLLEQFEPACKTLRRQLRKVNNTLPRWVTT